jgi:DNA polymerase III delta prime subunit
MQTKLLISSNLKIRKSKILEIIKSYNYNIPHPDVLYIDDEEKLGVEQTKKIRGFLSIKPYSAQGKAVVVISAHNLTPDAQNSLLKTLEEPPEESLIILGTEKEEQLLPTVLSRCEIIRIKDYLPSEESVTKNSDTDTPDINKLISSSVEERLEFIEKLEDKGGFLDSLIVFFRKRLNKGESNLEYIKLLLQAKKWQKSNVNLRAILEYLMLELPNS